MTDTPTPSPDDPVAQAAVAATGGGDLVAGGYPVDVDAQLLPEYSRFMPLISAAWRRCSRMKLSPAIAAKAK